LERDDLIEHGFAQLSSGKVGWYMGKLSRAKKRSVKLKLENVNLVNWF